MKFGGLLAIAAILGLCVFASAQGDRARPQKVKVSSGVAEGLKIHGDAPHYPREALEKKIQGDVILRATIDTKGQISDLEAITGDPILADAAIKAVKHWEYRPYLLNGQPIPVETTIKIQFHLG